MSKREEMFAMVQDYRDSGLSSTAYCEKRGIYRSLLYYWVKKFDEGASPGGFVQIKPRSSTNKTIEVKYPNGICITVPISELHLVQSLIRSY